MEELQAHTGSQFCPVVVAALEKIRASQPVVLAPRHLQAVADGAA
jgi:hypothetical protein